MNTSSKQKEQAKLSGDVATVSDHPHTSIVTDATITQNSNTSEFSSEETLDDPYVQPTQEVETTVELCEGEKLVRESETWEFDCLEERLLDVFMEDVECFSKSSFEKQVDVEAELAEMMEKADLDDDWHHLSDEAKTLLKDLKNVKTNKIYKRYWRMYKAHTTKNGT